MEISGSENREYERRKSDVAVENDRRNPACKKDKGLFECAFEAVPTFRRIESIADTADNGQTSSALGLAALALINLPEDVRDIQGACKQINHHLTGSEYIPAYDYKNYQHDFSFFKGTIIEKKLYEKAKEGKKWAQWLLDVDQPLARTDFGKSIELLVHANKEKTIKTSLENAAGKKIHATKYGGGAFAELTGRALRRTPVLGLAAMGLIEAPKILYSATEGETISEKASSAYKQSEKSAINVASLATGIGYCGAIGSKYGKGAGSLLGIAVGAALGNKVSQYVQEYV